ncbi:MAG: RidA family protein [Oscillibacter sp.]|nr:RidA family protein [Oscillibacter sp.]
MNKEANPVPQGNYVSATRFENLIFTAGMTPRINGVLMQEGKIGADVPVETYRDAVRQAAKNALTAARNKLTEGERIVQLLSVTVYVNGVEQFTKHSKIADLASEYFCEELGEAGIGSRAAVGVATLPGNAPVEISIVAAAGI